MVFIVPFEKKASMTTSKNINTALILHKEILSFKEALLYLDVSASFLYKLTSKKIIEFTKPNGGKIYFKKSVLDNWMLQNESSGISAVEEEVYNHISKNKN